MCAVDRVGNLSVPAAVKKCRPVYVGKGTVIWK
jgi:hypothetical protein